MVLSHLLRGVPVEIFEIIAERCDTSIGLLELALNLLDNFCQTLLTSLVTAKEALYMAASKAKLSICQIPVRGCVCCRRVSACRALNCLSPSPNNVTEAKEDRNKIGVQFAILVW